MRMKAQCWLVLIAGMIVAMASVPWSEAQSLPPPPVVRVPTEGVAATLTAKFRRPQSGQLFNDSNIGFHDVPLRFSPPGTTVTFPFRAVLEDDSKCGFGWSFFITVKRRGSARLGIPENLEILGHNGVIDRSRDPITGAIRESSRKVTLTLPEERPPNQQGGNCLFSRGPMRRAEQTFDVTVTLPRGINLVEIVAETEGGPGNDRFEVRKEFPSKTCEQPAFDNFCMLIAVAPTAVVIPHVIQLTIIYEPPGDRCSFAWIQDSHSAGVQMELTEAGAEEREALIDIKASLVGTPIEQSHTRQTQVRREERISRFEYSDGVKRGTAVDRELACENFMRDGPDKHGPGLGDKLEFLTNPQFFYWDVAGLSNYRYPVPVSDAVGPDVPGPQVQFAFAWELRNFLLTGDERVLPDFLQGATKEQICELARLDPFIQLPPNAPTQCMLPSFPRQEDCLRLDPKDMARAACERDVAKDMELDKQRFVKIGDIDWCELVEIQHKSTTSAEFTKFSAGSLSTISKEEPGKTTLTTAIEAVAFVGSRAAKALGNVDISPDFIEKGLNAVTLGYEDRSVITTTVTMTRNEGIDTIDSKQFTQTLFFQDKNPHACVAFYYNKIFGTIASKLQPGRGGFRNAQDPLSQKAQLIQTAAIVAGRKNAIFLSQGNTDLLTSQSNGPLSFALAQAEDYNVAEGTEKGLPSGMTLDPSTGALSGTAMVDSGQAFQALVVVGDASGTDVASLWLNIAVNQLGDVEGDDDVDNDDLNLLLDDLNTAVSDSVCGAACDLNGDGVINALDARQLVVLCTRPQCATQ